MITATNAQLWPVVSPLSATAVSAISPVTAVSVMLIRPTSSGTGYELVDGLEMLNTLEMTE